MIVTCENCATRFKFDERRIKPQGIKVHCSRCRRTFLLLPPGSPRPEASAETKPAAGAGGEDRNAVPPSASTAPPSSGAAPDLEKPPAAAPDVSTMTDREVYGQGDQPEDDPLADVPGFDPDALPSFSRSDTSEEEKALEALTRDEQLESGVSEALDRFGVSAPEERGPDSLDLDDDPAGPDADQPDAIRGEDGAGDGDELQGEPEDGFGAPALDGDEAQESGGASDEFDWDQVSFAKDRTGPDAGTADKDGETGEGDETDFIERNAHDPGTGSAAGGHSPVGTETAAPDLGEGDSLELDLPASAPQRLRAPEASPPAVEAPAAPAGGTALDLTSPSAAGPDTAASAKPAAVKKPRPVAIPPLRLRARADRGRLVVPGLTGLVLSIALGMAAAVAGAILTYMPARDGSLVARAVGEASGRTGLVIEDPRGVTVERLQGGSLYLVTGTARWEEPAERTVFLEGIIVDDAGEVLERRPARLGERPDWQALDGIDPDRFTSAAPLPSDGETPFSVLFAPDPSWRGEVRFEVRPGG